MISTFHLALILIVYYIVVGSVVVYLFNRRTITDNTDDGPKNRDDYDLIA